MKAMTLRYINSKRIRVLVICLFFTVTIALFISVQTPDGTGNVKSYSGVLTNLLTRTENTPKISASHANESHSQHKNIMNSLANYQLLDSHKLAIIVPFRDRLDELMEFAPHMHEFLTDKGISYELYVINQVDTWRFNRASLINIGFLLSESTCDYIAMHDVDLLPLNRDLPYGYPHDGPLHVSAPELHPLYHYSKFIGGILLMNRHHFRLVNGLSNRFWGWGREDDELYVRIRNAGLKVYRPVGITTGSRDTFRHIHDKNVRKRDNKQSKNQREAARKLDRNTGLDTLIYNVDSIHRMTIEGAPLQMVNVRLYCNITDTPWCIRPQDIVGQHTRVVQVT